MKKICLAILLFLTTAGLCSGVTNRFQITFFDATGRLSWSNQTRVTFPAAVSNAVYQVQTATNLSLGSRAWTSLPGFNAVRATGYVASVKLPETKETRFYRVNWINPVLADSEIDFSGTQGLNN